MKFDSKPVGTSIDLPRLVASVKPGSKVNLQVWHKGANKDVAVTVAEFPAEKDRPMPASKRGKGLEKNKLGLTLSELGAEQRKELKIGSGVLVEDVHGAAAKAGLQPGDVILAINNSEVKTVDQFNETLSKLDGRKNLALLVKRGESTQYITVRLEQG
jgi:serine protease Do